MATAMRVTFLVRILRLRWGSLRMRTTPHQCHCYPGHKGGSNVSEANGMDGGQIMIQGHNCQDVRADNLTVGIKRCNYSAHGATEAPGAVAYKLVDEERHA